MGWNLPPGCTDADIDRACPGYHDEPEQEEPEMTHTPWSKAKRSKDLRQAYLENYKAQQRLEAAAPELLEALKDVVLSGALKDYAILLSHVRAAIAKAEGTEK